MIVNHVNEAPKGNINNNNSDIFIKKNKNNSYIIKKMINQHNKNTIIDLLMKFIYEPKIRLIFSKDNIINFFFEFYVLLKITFYFTFLLFFFFLPFFWSKN